MATDGGGRLAESSAASAPQSVGQQAQAAGNSSTNAGEIINCSCCHLPDQLEQWLLLECGRSYENDISKIKGEYIATMIERFSPIYSIPVL